MTEKMAISKKQIRLEAPMVAVEIIEGCVYSGLFGSIDSSRMHDISEKIIKLAEYKDIKIVIIDLSNVTVIDSSVANFMNKFEKTLKFLGIKMILCGIQSELANVMVKANVDINSDYIVKNLKFALSLSYKFLGYKVVKIDT